MTAVVMVTLGAIVGGPSRYLLDRWLQARLVPNHPRRIPIGTLTVNILGSAVLGVATTLLTGPAYSLVATGFCGSFTTFSTFAALTDESWREGWPIVATANAAVSVVACLLAFWATQSLVSG